MNDVIEQIRNVIIIRQRDFEARLTPPSAIAPSVTRKTPIGLADHAPVGYGVYRNTVP